MEPSATISANLDAWLAHNNLPALATVEVIDTHTDRVSFTDAAHSILLYGLMNGWDVSEPSNHGKSVIVSLRERSTPSLQLCVHRGIDAETGSRYLLYEVDFDFSPPISPAKVAIHAGEVIANKFTGRKTDQEEVARRLAARFKEGESNAA